MIGGQRGIYSESLAARYKEDAGKSFRPSNGFEGELFEQAWCRHCRCDQADDPSDGCPIIVAAMALSEDHHEYPKEWQIGDDGQPVCTAFDWIHAPPLAERTPRCPDTPDMFGEA